jgi:murein L,D-transpeptidase YafK
MHDFSLPMKLLLRPIRRIFLSLLKLLPFLLTILIVSVDCSHAGSSAWAYQGRGRANQLRVVIHKNAQLLDIQGRGNVLRRYRVCLGLNPKGAKKAAGDRRTPEGEYFICMKQAGSKFHRFLGISYPGEQDARRAFEKGLISLDARNSIIEKVRQGKTPPWNTKLGGWVGIHGYPTDDYRRLWISLFFPKPHNWTDGCIALWNFEVEELFRSVPVGTPVTILP